MADQETRPKRKYIRLPAEAYANPASVFFITIDADRRQRFFADEEFNNSVIEELRKACFRCRCPVKIYCLMRVATTRSLCRGFFLHYYRNILSDDTQMANVLGPKSPRHATRAVATSCCFASFSSRQVICWRSLRNGEKCPRQAPTTGTPPSGRSGCARDATWRTRFLKSPPCIRSFAR